MILSLANDPGVRAALALIHRETNEESRQSARMARHRNFSNAARLRWSNPDYRAKMRACRLGKKFPKAGAAIKRAWAEGKYEKRKAKI